MRRCSHDHAYTTGSEQRPCAGLCAFHQETDQSDPEYSYELAAPPDKGGAARSCEIGLGEVQDQTQVVLHQRMAAFQHGRL